jgi:regulator of sigma E protease
MAVYMGIVLAIVVLSLLIIIHELGHFLVAKAFKVKVNEFSLFMGPKLWSFQKGETTYSLRLIPLGGYVKMEGEEEASDDARAFNRKPIGVRAAIIAAGPK